MVFGFGSSGPKWDITKDIPDLKGKVILVTGGNSGLGFAQIQHLVRHGAKIYLGARNEAKAKEAIAKMDLGEGSVEFLEVNLSDPAKAKEAAERFLGKEKRLDVLVNNAAITVVPFKKTWGDLQDVMVVNYLSPFVFTRTLLPLLEQTAKEPGADVRIVNVASGAIMNVANERLSFKTKEDWNDMHGSEGTISALKRYGRSKTAEVLWTKELQRRFDAEKIPIIVSTLHPGMINTEGNQNFAKTQNFIVRPLTTLLFNMSPSSEKGSYTQTFLSVAPVVRQEAEKYKGAFLWPPANIAKTTTKDGDNPELAVELWETTEKFLKDFGI